MKTDKLIFGAALFILLLIVSPMVNAFYATESTVSNNLGENTPEEFYSNLLQNKNWIVILESEGVIEHKISMEKAGIVELDSATQIYELQVELEQSQTLKSIKDKSVFVTGNAKNLVNMISIKTTDHKKIAEIAQLPNVKKIIPDNGQVVPLLYDAVDIVRATETYQLLDSQNNPMTGQGITIAIVDSGVDYTHVDLGSCTTEEFLAGNCDKVIGGYDTVSEDFDPMDDFGHGTHVASTAAGKGVLNGVAPDAKILAYKVLGVPDSGELVDINTVANVIEALDRAMDPNGDGQYNDRPDIIHMSLGLNAEDVMSVWTQVVANIIEEGVIVTISAGNSGYDGTYTIGTPGVYEKAITVGAACKPDVVGVDPICVSQIGGVAGFSSVGPTMVGAQKPDIVAPGHLICAALLPGWEPWRGRSIYQKCMDDEHVLISGTSMSGPVVAGVVALMKQAHPDWSVQEIKNTLKGTAVDFGVSPLLQGMGQVDALAAVQTNIPYPTAQFFPDYDSTFVADQIILVGTASSTAQFLSYSVSYKIGFQSEDPWQIAFTSSTPVVEDNLGLLDLENIPDGSELVAKLEVVDSLGQVSIDYIYFFKKPVEWAGNWPKRIAHDFFGFGSPLIADLDNDGVEEIITVSTGPDYGEVAVYSGDGIIKEGFPVSFAGGLGFVPAIGDVDGDGDLEIVYKKYAMFSANNKVELFVWNHDGTNLAGWPKELPFELVATNSPILADVDGDMQDEIIVNVVDQSGINSNGLRIYNYDGSVTYGDWEFISHNLVDPLVSDIDADGVLDIIYFNKDTDKMYAWNIQTGLLDGFPTDICEMTRSSGQLIADIDNDLDLEIILVCGSEVQTYDFHGNLENQISIVGGGHIAIAKNYEGDNFLFNSKYQPLILDYDNDQILEAVYSDYVDYEGGIIRQSELYPYASSSGKIIMQNPLYFDAFSHMTVYSSYLGATIGNVDDDQEIELVTTYATGGNPYGNVFNGLRPASIGSWLFVSEFADSLDDPFWSRYRFNTQRTGELPVTNVAQSIVVNNREVSFIGILSVEIEKFDQEWVVYESIIIDQQIEVDPQDSFSLASFVNPLEIEIPQSGEYRIVATISDFVGNVIINSLGIPLMEKYEFTVLDEGFVCTDETPYYSCVEGSAPDYCAVGEIVNNCNACGCPSDSEYICLDSGICEEVFRCADGTEYAYCGSLQPTFCDQGLIIEDCQTCGCLQGEGYEFCQEDGTCDYEYCSDGTLFGTCSETNPLFCDAGNLENKCSTCGCPTDQACGADEICRDIVYCYDNFIDGQCSSNQPLYCDGEDYILDCELCGCPNGEICQADGTCPSSLPDLIVEVEQVNSLPLGSYDFSFYVSNPTPIGVSDSFTLTVIPLLSFEDQFVTKTVVIDGINPFETKIVTIPFVVIGGPNTRGWLRADLDLEEVITEFYEDNNDGAGGFVN